MLKSGGAVLSYRLSGRANANTEMLRTCTCDSGAIAVDRGASLLSAFSFLLLHRDGPQTTDYGWLAVLLRRGRGSRTVIVAQVKTCDHSGWRCL